MAENEEITFLTRKVLELNTLLVQSEKAKSRFLSLIANELNNPMTAILGMLPRFAPPSDDPKAALFDLLQEEAFRLNFRIQNLMAAAEIESGIVNFSHALIDPMTLIDEAIDTLRFSIKAKKMNIQVCNELGTSIVSDPLKLYLIIINLLANAVCYGYEQGNIAVKLYEEEGNFCLSVSDEGEAPNVEFKPQIYTRFAYEPTSEMTGVHGLGIGLGIVRDICERMDGSIDYTSDNGRVIFIVTLPLKVALPDSEACGSNDFLFDSFDDAIEI